MNKMQVVNARTGEKDGEETVVQFAVTLQWGGDYRNTKIGVTKLQVNIEGAASSSQAIAQAIELIRSIEPTEPSKASAELQQFTRKVNGLLVPKGDDYS